MVDDYWFEAFNINSFKSGYRVIKDLSLRLKYSENVLLLGPNGSGKSSIVDLINRNIYPVLSSDQVLKIFNKEHINIWELRKKISTVNNEIKKRIHPNLKILDLIISGLYGKYCLIQNKTERDLMIAENHLYKMNLSNLAQKNFSCLSDGEKQFVLIARALIRNPKILILDEPVANLDYKSRFFVIDQIDELSKLNTKIFCITHDITMITKIYDRIIMLKNGNIIADGNQKEVLNNRNLNRLFDINVELIQNKGHWTLKRLIK